VDHGVAHRGAQGVAGERTAHFQAIDRKICTAIDTGRAEFSAEAFTAGGGALWPVFLPHDLR
jgi:hypothetical protein